MPYRDDLETSRIRLREVERELAELDVRLAQLDELADRRRALCHEAAQLRQLLHPPIARRAVPQGRIIAIIAGVMVGAGIAGVVITRKARPELLPSAPAPPAAPAPAPTPPIPPATGDCAAALEHPTEASEAVLRSCGATHGLGRCRLFEAKSCASCGCTEYVGLDGACDAQGGCGEPLLGTGCASGPYYRHANHGIVWSCESGDLAACMLRRMAQWGYCTGQGHIP